MVAKKKKVALSKKEKSLNNKLAIISVLLGFIGLMTSLIAFLGLFFGALTVAIGKLSMSKKTTNYASLAGILMGVITTIINLMIVCWYIFGFIAYSFGSVIIVASQIG